MVARWLQAKLIKRTRERRAWARPLSIKSSAGPNWHNGWVARNAPLDVDEERMIANQRRVLDVNGRDTRRVPDISEIRKDIPDAFFVSTPCDTPYHRCRIYFNSQRTIFIIQYVIWPEHVAKLSFKYPEASKAWQAFTADRCLWRKTIHF